MNARQIWKPSPLKTSPWWVVLISLLWSTLAQLDPIGATTAANQHSEDFLIRLFGTWYPDDARDRITVVLIDDAYLNSVNSAWPLSYAQQELLLDEILSYEPQAVFLDLLHLHRHPSAFPGAEENNDNNEDNNKEKDPALRQLMHRIKAMNESPFSPEKPEASLFLPYLVRDFPGKETCSDSLDTLGNKALDILVPAEITPRLIEQGAQATYLGWSGCGSRYPALIFGEPSMPTPAFALYQHYCDKKFNQTAGEPRGCRPAMRLDVNNVLSQPAMMVRWGSGSSDLMKAAYSQANLDTQCKPGTVRSRLVSIVHDLIHDENTSSEINPCPYTDTVNAGFLPGGRIDNEPWLEAMLQDRIVLVGTWLEGVQDSVVSPVHGTIPGVYLLAAALDNYLVYGRDHFREVSPRLVPLIEFLLLSLTTLLIQAAWKLRWKPMLPVDGTTQTTLLLAAGVTTTNIVIYKLLLPLGIALPTAVTFWLLGWAPVNWLAITTLAFLANPVHLHHCFSAGEDEAIPPADDERMNINHSRDS